MLRLAYLNIDSNSCRVPLSQSVNWIVAALVTFTVITAYSYCINAEEHMLVAAFREHYAAYVKHTWRLLRFVW
jgi:protein-S-isoprenylcysteine O-methyltransferase Ste14